MDGSEGGWAATFPALFTADYVHCAGRWLAFMVDPVPDELIARLHRPACTPRRLVIASLTANPSPAPR